MTVYSNEINQIDPHSDRRESTLDLEVNVNSSHFSHTESKIPIHPTHIVLDRLTSQVARLENQRDSMQMDWDRERMTLQNKLNTSERTQINLQRKWVIERRRLMNQLKLTYPR